jgi:hypothetical protein
MQSTTRVKPFICTMPMRLDEGWNQIQFNLSDFTRRAYGGRPAGALQLLCSTSPPCTHTHARTHARTQRTAPQRTATHSPQPLEDPGPTQPSPL